VLDRHWLRVYEQHVRLANGHEIEQFHLLSGPSWTGIVCLTHEKQVVLVRQYRHGIAGSSLELPAGVIEADEAPFDAARRELREETGYVATEWQALLSMVPEPVRSNTRAHFFCALGAELQHLPQLDASEEIEVVLVAPADISGLIDSGEILHGVHIGALLLADKRGFFG
jgi:8-oxo-dGTP pyrophosphatase MutT (NUDIX family)